ncbi:PIG-L family deacetylase [Maribacter sp. PR1]|uniref:PIG-L deacetylase family protein n=1 Tax=Maribacter cobaltidurans TaxID=1178778 RepID=A0ABU7IQL9_9FLAO|nr:MULTISPECIES: PIG-L deacetylase family protein [Maribacter]MDC6387861.1 PIG-L family deacetylase [Maribacter sp. PR1]MEE1975250.1 PIG-L deacetylase family protein [Maribacter cobaltidurans]
MKKTSIVTNTIFRLSAFAFIIFLLVGSTCLAQKPYEGKVLLAVFAHPDDESTVSPILAKYAREGAKVHLVIVTDGRYGTNDFHDHIAGETLVATRKKEMKCAAELLEAELIHLNFHDQLRAAEGYDGHVPHAREMIKQLNEIVNRLNPDAIITWGPDGGSTHMDHRLVGASVTQVYLSQDWNKPMDLFYYGTPSDAIDDPEGKILRGQAGKYLRTKVSYTDQDLEKAAKSYRCHYSQIDPMLTEENFMERKSKNGKFVYLRKFEAPKNDSDSVFGNN